MQLLPETYAEMRIRYGLGADLHVARDHAIVGCVIGLAWACRCDNDLTVEHECPECSSIAVACTSEDTDMRHSRLHCLGMLEKNHRVSARHMKWPSPASSVQSGTARATTALFGSGPK